MSEAEERPSERVPTVQIRELPGKPYRVTMEVPLFLSIMGVSLSGAAISNMILYRTCVNTLGHSTDECKVFLSPKRANVSQHLEEEVQQYVTYIFAMKTFLESIGPAILSFFLGVWSDTHGRKPLVVWPLFGMTLSTMLIVFYSMFESLGPWWYVLTAVPFSLTGGYTVMFTGSFCYLSDITSTQSRSLRMTILEAAVSVGSVIGSISSSYLLKAVGTVYLMLIVSALYVAAYVFTNVCLKESLAGAVQGGLSTVLDFSLVKEMMRECFKRRPNKVRSQILLLTAANCISIFILYGFISLDYMYTREKLHWAIKEFTIFSAVGTTISFVGSFIAVGLVQKVLGVGDCMFTIIAFLSSTAQYIIWAFATQSWHMYLGSSIALFKGVSAPLIRSTISKILPVEDIAKVFSLMCAIEGVSPLIAPGIFNTLYKYTIITFPGAIYVLCAALTTCCVVLVGLVQYYRWKAAPLAYTNLEQSNVE